MGWGEGRAWYSLSHSGHIDASLGLDTSLAQLRRHGWVAAGQDASGQKAQRPTYFLGMLFCFILGGAQCRHAQQIDHRSDPISRPVILSAYMSQRLVALDHLVLYVHRYIHMARSKDVSDDHPHAKVIFLYYEVRHG